MTRDFIYLASASPRRRALLEQIGVPFKREMATIDERRAADESPAHYVRRLAQHKADAVWARVLASGEPAPVLAADTAVVVDDDVFGKPRDEADAERMLERLSGRSHMVLTAVSLRCDTERGDALSSSEVRFRTTTDAERSAYCRTREPFDKAGAYGIQGLGAVFIDHIVGSYSAVMGLPLLETARLLGRYGLPRWLNENRVDQ